MSASRHAVVCAGLWTEIHRFVCFMLLHCTDSSVAGSAARLMPAYQIKVDLVEVIRRRDVGTVRAEAISRQLRSVSYAVQPSMLIDTVLRLNDMYRHLCWFMEQSPYRKL